MNVSVFSPGYPEFTSSMQCVQLSLPGVSGIVDVEVLLGGVSLLKEAYYVSGGMLTLFDLGSIIELHLREIDKISDVCVIKVDDTQVLSFTVLYCLEVASAPAYDFLSSNFITSRSTLRMPPGQSVALNAWLYEEPTPCVHVHCRTTDPTHSSYTFDVPLTGAPASGLVACSFSFADLMDEMPEECDEKTELIEATFRLGERSQTVFFDRALSNVPSFLFRSNYGIFEVVWLQGETITKSVTEHSAALIGGLRSLYDRSFSRSFEMQTAPLPPCDAECIPELFYSDEVYRVETETRPEGFGSAMTVLPVIITNSECEFSDGPEPPTAKFTWQYMPERPLRLVRSLAGVFTSQFNPVFI